jgi:MFS family permease
VRARLAVTFQSLTVRNFRLFSTGQLTKLIGVWMQFTAQDWLVLSLSHNSAYALGVVSSLQFLPVLLFSLYGGKLADRYDKRKLLIAANVVFSGLALTMGLLVATGRVTLGWVFVLAALIGTANSIETPVRQAFVSELVERRLLPNALSLSAATFNSARILGPAVAGGAIALVGTPPVFLLNVVTYLAPMVSLLRMRPAELYRERVERRAGTSIREGLRYVLRREDLLLPLIVLFVVAMFGFNFQLTLPVLARTVFHVGAGQFGLLTTALATGALGGALAGSSRRARPGVYTVLGSAVAFGVLETVVGFGPSFWVTAVLLLPTGFCMIFFAQATNQRIQLGTDAAHRGRVMAVFVLVFLGTTPVGSLVVGWGSERFGPRTGVWAGGILSEVAAVAALLWQLRRSGDRVVLALRPRPRLYVRVRPDGPVAPLGSAAPSVEAVPVEAVPPVSSAQQVSAPSPLTTGPTVEAAPAASARPEVSAAPAVATRPAGSTDRPGSADGISAGDDAVEVGEVSVGV